MNTQTKRWRIVIEARKDGAIGEWQHTTYMQDAETAEEASQKALDTAHTEGLETRFVVGVHER